MREIAGASPSRQGTHAQEASKTLPVARAPDPRASASPSRSWRIERPTAQGTGEPQARSPGRATRSRLHRLGADEHDPAPPWGSQPAPSLQSDQSYLMSITIEGLHRGPPPHKFPKRERKKDLKPVSKGPRPAAKTYGISGRAVP